MDGGLINVHLVPLDQKKERYHVVNDENLRIFDILRDGNRRRIEIKHNCGAVLSIDFADVLKIMSETM